ncbi:hypothetical protein H9P43_005360 [Blastocladiella emersonii ATCC 22665]|nr:hypothetical protein H9P43_005360 [Blastocladiella emersonii ATCC 22665]
MTIPAHVLPACMKQSVLAMAKKQKWLVYAVARGRKPGVYGSWDEVREQVEGYAGARHKGFNSLAEAKAFVVEGIKAAAAAAPQQRKSSAGSRSGASSPAEEETERQPSSKATAWADSLQCAPKLETMLNEFVGKIKITVPPSSAVPAAAAPQLTAAVSDADAKVRKRKRKRGEL